jgi:hypothetical protein
VQIPILLRLLGAPPQGGAHGSARLVFASGWSARAAIALVLIAAAWTLVHYLRDGSRPSWWVKGPLVALRLLAFLALIVMLAQPVLRYGRIETIKPAAVVLVDASQSMAQGDRRIPPERARLEAAAAGISPDAVAAMARLRRVDAMLRRSKLFRKLAPNFEVRLYAFSNDARRIALPAGKDPALTPDAHGDSTQIGTALRHALYDLAGQPLAGAIVLSDGGNNLGEDPVDVADAARQQRLPISTMGFGDPTPTKDVALLSVLADDVVRSHNAVSVYAALTQRGYPGKTVTLTLRRGGEQIARQSLRLGPNGRKQEVRFTYVPEHAGRFYYTVSVSPQPDEVTLANNRRGFVQTVIDKKLKVLFVENEPRYEYRYLRNAILRDKSLEFACLLLQGDNASTGGEGNLPIRSVPADEKTLFDYDMVILGDVPRAAFSDAQLAALRRFVEDRGGSLLVIAGEQHMPFEFAGTPLEAVLPVEIASVPNPVLTDDPFRIELTPEGRRSTIMMLEDDPLVSAHVWEHLPGMYWAAGVPRARPGATVYAVHPTRRNASGPYVLMAAQPFGAGKSYIQLVDSTYLWRWRVGDRYFYRYWGQVLRSLTPKELPGNSHLVQLNADRNSYRLGETVTLNARLLDAYYHPLRVPAATAEIRSEEGPIQRITLQATPGAPGLYTAQYQPERVGRFSVTLASPADPRAKAGAGFLVESLALERQKPELDETLLKRMAAAGGGRYYVPTAIDAWVKSLSDRPLSVRNEQEVELWDRPLLLFILIGALSLEWIVRKRSGLL